MTKSRSVLVFVCSMAIALELSGGLASAQGRGVPFQALQSQIDQLQAQIHELEIANRTGGLILAGGCAPSARLSYSSNTITSDPVEEHFLMPLPADGRLTAFAVSTFINSFTGPAVFTVRVNGVDTSLQISVPAGSKSVHLTTGNVVVIAGDRVTVQIDGRSAPTGDLCFQGSYQYSTK